MSDDAPPQTRRPSRAAIALLVFLFANGILINLALPRLPWQPQITTTLGYTDAFLKRGAHSDSWKPMRTALFFVDEPRQKPLYTVVYFDNNVRFQYPPSSLLVLEALRLLPIEAPIGDDVLNDISWWSVWLLAGVVARIFYLARRRYATSPASRADEFLFIALALFVTLTFYPVVRGYYLGQIQVWIDLLVAAVVWAWLEGRRTAAGVLVSLICVVKPTLALVVIWGVLRRHWDFALGFAVPMSIFALISLGMYGWENHVDYLRVLSYISQHGEIFHPNQSMNGLLHRLIGNGNSAEWSRDVLMTYNPWVHAGTLASSVALLGLGLGFGHVRRRRSSADSGVGSDEEQPTMADRHDPFDLAIVILCSTLAAPTVWTHHYGVTLPLFALAFPAVLSLPAPARRHHLIALAVAFVFISNNFRALNRLAETPLNFLQSYVFFAGLLFLALLCLVKRRIDAARTGGVYGLRG